MFHETSGHHAPLPADEQHRVEDIVSQGPGGAIAVAGVAVVIVLALWFAFYFLVFIPRT
jgi:hypothetical protein